MFFPSQTDVVVNSTGGDLHLSNGAVSKAILSQAGKKMQEEMDQKYKKPNIHLPPVLETKAHGLKCKQVYHTLCVAKDMANAEWVILQLFIIIYICISTIFVTNISLLE